MRAPSLAVGVSLALAVSIAPVTAKPAADDLASAVTFSDPAMTKSAEFALSTNAQLLKDERYEGAPVLKISGIGKDDVYGAWLRNLKPKPNKYYRLSLYSKVTKSFERGAEPILMVFFYKDPARKERTGIEYVRLPLKREWQLTSRKMLIPEGTDNLSIGFRLSGPVPRSEALHCAKIEFAEFPGDPYVGFPTVDFEGWDARKRHDVRIGPGAAVRTTTVGTGLAHSGEWYLEIEGINHSTQYGLIVDDIWVKPNTVYNLSCFYRMTADFSPRTFIVMVFQFAGAPWRSERVKTNYWYAAGYRQAPEWTGASFDVVTHEKAATMAILFRQEHVLPGNSLFLDDITLKKSDPTVFLRWEIDPKTAVLSGSVKPSGDILGESKMTTVYIIRENEVVEQQDMKPQGGKFSFDLHAFTDNVPYYITAAATLRDGRRVPQRNDDVIAGIQTLKVNLRDGTKLLLPVNDKNNLFYTFVKSRPWEGNRIGVLAKNDQPPPPWSPVGYDAKRRTVTTWNNTVRLGKGLGSLRVSFRKPRQELTTEPIQLTLNGKDLSEVFRFSELAAPYVSPNRVVVKSTGSDRNVKIETSAVVEFDGFIRHTVVIQPAGGGAYEVEKLALTLKFPKDYIRFCYAQGGLTFEPSWSIREFRPTLWLGNYDTGVLWCTERLFPGVKKHDTAWAELSSSKTGESILTINLVNKPLQVADQPLKVEFGLLPTPARPFRPRVRNVRFRSGEDATLDVTGTMPGEAFKYFGYPEITSREEFSRHMAAREMPRADTLYYFGVNYAMETIPQMTYFKKEWINVPAHRYTTDHPAYHQYATGDYTTVKWGKSWTDLCLFKFKEFVEQTGVKGAYYDTAYPSVVEENGEWSCPVFAGREFHKRVYVLLHQMFPGHAWTIYHHGPVSALPYSAFGDFLLKGEHFREQLRRHTYYLEFLTLPEIRATVAAPLGPAHLLLPQYWQREKAANRALMAQVGGLAMIHDALLWVAGQEVLLQMMRERINFGDLSQARWYPYWEKNPYLHSDNEAVLLSFYERQGDLFIIPFNATDKEVQVNLSFENYLKKFPGADGIRIYDPVTDKAEMRKITDGRINLSFAPYVPRLLTLTRVGRF